MAFFMQNLPHPSPHTTVKAQLGLLWRREQDTYTQAGIFHRSVTVPPPHFPFSSSWTSHGHMAQSWTLVSEMQSKTLTAMEVSGREENQLAFPINLFPFYYLLPGNIDVMSKSSLFFRFNCSDVLM